MLQSIAILAVAALTVLALERLLTRVGAYVNTQVVAFATPVRTMWALKVAHVSMLRHVGAVVISGLESLATNMTRKWSHIVVDSLDMRIQLEFVGEHFGAQVTTVALGMFHLVNIQLRFGVASERAMVAFHIFL